MVVERRETKQHNEIRRILGELEISCWREERIYFFKITGRITLGRNHIEKATKNIQKCWIYFDCSFF